MADDHDALLARADHYIDSSPTYPGIPPRSYVLIQDLAAAVRDLLADRIAGLEVIARLTTGWDLGPMGGHWHLDDVLADDDDNPLTDLMSDREWRVFCDAAQRATRNTT